MTKFVSTVLLCCFFILASLLVWASEENKPTSTNTDVMFEVFTLKNPKVSVLPIEQVDKIALSQWQKRRHDKVVLHPGQNWIAIQVKSNLKETVERVVVIDGRQFITSHGFYESSKQRHSATHLSETGKNNVIFSHVQLYGNASQIYYVQVNSRASTLATTLLLTSNDASHFIAKDNFSSGIAIGGLVAMTLMLGLVFLATLNQHILLLTGYFGLLSANLAVMYGFTIASFFPELQEIHGVEFPLFSSLSAILILWFSSELFKLELSHRRLYWLYHGFGWSMLLYVALSFFLSFDTNMLMSNITQQLVTIFLLFLAIHLWRHQHKLAPLFVSFVVIHALFNILNISLYGYDELNASLHTTSYWTTGLLIIFLLGRKSSSEIGEKHVAQREALESAMDSRKAQEELLALQEENQEQLEQAVQERTLELNIALQELEEANRELEQKNTIDDLTGLFNRRYYDQKLLAEFRRSRRNLTPLSLVVIDIDHFKLVNDTHGHSAGDVCLVKLARIIKQSLGRSSDIGCRYGGEEFCLVLPETDTEGAKALAEEVREQVQNSLFDIGSNSLSLTISCGVSTYKQQSSATPVDIFNAADKALYQAKEKGRNRVIATSIAQVDEKVES